MKTRILVLIPIVVAVVLATWAAVPSQQKNKAARTSAPPTSAGTLHVDDYMRNIDSYPGQVTITGVVKDAISKQQTFTIIDTSEFERCLSTECSILFLPVKWEGKMPAERDWVKVTGKISKTGGKLVFAAESVEKLRSSAAGAKR